MASSPKPNCQTIWPDNDESEEDCPVEIQIIRKNRPLIIRRINACELLDYFPPNMFTEEERQKIKCESVQSGLNKAARHLLEFLIRKPDGWFDEFLAALENDQMDGPGYDDISTKLREDLAELQIEYHEIFFHEPPQITGGDMAEPKQGKTISSSGANVDLSKQETVNSKNTMSGSLMKEKQFDKKNDLSSNKEKMCAVSALGADDAGISSDFTRGLRLDEEPTCAKQLWSTDNDDNSVPTFCTPSVDRQPHLQYPGGHWMDNLSGTSTEEKTKMVHSDEDYTKSISSRKKYNRLKVLNFKPRDYQTELAERPKEGKNTIICSPTNSGKTYVAIMVTKHHLYEKEIFNPEENNTEKRQDPKVLVVVPRFALLQQVCKDFRSHLPLYHIGTRFGGSTSKTSLKGLTGANDIVIVTADILKNALGGVSKLSDFSLIILDECHYTMKDHSYNDIMERYVSEKHSSSSVSQPQVLGLTASPGAGKIPDVLSAKNSILRLCANLDAYCFVTVQQNLENLAQYTSTPRRNVIKAGKRAPNPFRDILTPWMNRLENDFDLVNTCEKSTQEYESFIVDKRKNILSAEDFKGTTVCDHLIKLNNALILSDTVRMTDGVKLIQNFYDETETRILRNPEEWLHQIYKANIWGLQLAASLEKRYPNPKLDELRHEILSHKDTCSLSDIRLRVIIFVKTKEITQAMLEWMKDDETLKEFNPSPFTGVRADVEKGGMSKQLQKDVLAAFENGVHQILISTSVGEEGIDIPECSLTIRYDHVTNEISMIQSRGRVRQRLGKEVILGENPTLEKDSHNLLLEGAMVEAMKGITTMSTEDLRKLILEIQRDAFVERQHKIERKRLLENSHQAESVQLFCKGCRVFVCKASDIRLFLKTNHILIGDNFKELIDVGEHPDKEKAIKYNMKKISCKTCKKDWGNTVDRVKCYPCLKISSFYSKIDGEFKSFKQWKKVPYTIEVFKQE